MKIPVCRFYCASANSLSLWEGNKNPRRMQAKDFLVSLTSLSFIEEYIIVILNSVIV